MEDLNEKNAKLTMKLVAKSGYKVISEDQVSPNQWRDINLVLTGELSSENNITTLQGVFDKYSSNLTEKEKEKLKEIISK